MVFPTHVHLVTLGVRDVAASTAFYERLGWRKSSASNEGISFFQGRGAILAVWGREDLAKDARADAQGHGFRGVALAANVPRREDVDAALAAAEKAGARIAKPAEDAFWGGRSGYFADPDGHLWEVAWNPHFPMATDGSVALPP
ncbi:MAG TPA: VOC family protein [Candidatus Thermoplasmatota archaeon]|nr:VOC family protein [Candidatus Thermoplasmatota archaeon]